MKKRTTTILSLLLLALTANAQITLLHTFTTKERPPSLSNNNVVMLTSTSRDYFYYSDKDANKLEIYKTDCTLYKSIPLTIPSGYTLSDVRCLSDKIFNNDDKLDFIVICSKTESGVTTGSAKLFNEDGTMLKDLGDKPYASVYLIASENKYILFIYQFALIDGVVTYITDIYSLPGVPSDNISVSKAGVMEMQYAYPNPSNTTITLPYSLAPGQSSVMSIYDAGGQLIDTKLIDSNFDKIQLNVNSYRSGIYLYEYNGVSSRFMIE